MATEPYRPSGLLLPSPCIPMGQIAGGGEFNPEEGLIKKKDRKGKHVNRLLGGKKAVSLFN